MTCQFKPFLAGHVEKMQPMPVCCCMIENLHSANVGVLLHCRKAAGLFGPQSLFSYNTYIYQKAPVSSPFPSYLPLSWWCMLNLLIRFDWMAGTAWVL
jgi:hypothetical protein